MYIDKLSDEHILKFIERDIKICESQTASRCDGAAFDLMADLFARDHSNNNTHYMYEINKIIRKKDVVIVKGYAVRVKSPGRGIEYGNVWKGNFKYELTDTNIKKEGNISAGAFSFNHYVKFIYQGLTDEDKVIYKKIFIESAIKEAERFLEC